MDIGTFGKGKGKQSKGTHGEGKGKGKQGQQGQHGQDKDKSKDKNKDSIECWNCGKRGHYSVGTGRTPTKVVRRVNTNPRMQMLTILTRNHQMLNQKSKSVDSTFLTLMLTLLKCEGLNGSRSESTQSITYGKTIPGDSDLTFRTATGELVKGGKQMQIEGCDDWGSNLKIRGVQATVCKPLLSVGEYTTMGGVTVLYGDKGYMFHKGSNVAKKIDVWIQKELRDSQYRGCTVAYKENNVYNIYMKPRRNKIDAMPLSGDSELGGCRLGPNL